MSLYHSLEEFVDQLVAQLVVQQFLEFLHWQLNLQEIYKQYVELQKMVVSHPVVLEGCE